jgi:copine 5/8/9
MALDAVGSVMSNYDSDQLYPVFGFGGIPPGETKTSHCFSISPGNEQIKGINEVLSAYRTIAPKVQMSGPTNFAPVFRKAIEIVDREDKPQHYYILFILTDGEIHDMKETVDCLVEISSRNLPISVVIVGVGNEDFANMVRLDGDEVAV